MAVKLIIDSASDISVKEAQELGVAVVPLTITFGEEDFEDGVTLSPVQFYEKLVNEKSLPKTSQANAFKFEEEIEKIVNSGDEAVIITISSKLSGTYNSACQAASKYEGKVYVVDSMTACSGEGLLGLYAVELINQGKSAKEIVGELEVQKDKIHVFAMIDTLKYLKKGGRISAVAAFAGELLSLKPIVKMVDGQVKMIGKCMGAKKGMAFLDKVIANNGGIDYSKPYCLIWSGTEDSNVKKYIEESTTDWKDKDKLERRILGGTIGTHIGPGAVGVAFFAK